MIHTRRIMTIADIKLAILEDEPALEDIPKTLTLTEAEAAEAFGVTKATMGRLRTRGLVAHYRFQPGAITYTARDLVAYGRSTRVEATSTSTD
jgi:hypothetical protein